MNVLPEKEEVDPRPAAESLPEDTPQDKGASSNILVIAGRKIFAFFSSFLLVAVILFFLLLITYFGTVAQVNTPLYVVQYKYFESLYVLHPWDSEAADPLLIPLPGGYLLMSVLFVNLLCGAIIRARKSWRRPGMLIAHSSMLIFIAAGAVSLYFKEEGHLSLYPGEVGSVIQTFRDWEIKIVEMPETGEPAEYSSIPKEHFEDLEPGETRTFFSSELPFDLTIRSYYEDAFVDSASRSAKAPARDIVNDFYLEEQKGNNQDKNPGMVVELAPKNGTDSETAILWGLSPFHYVTEVEGRTFAMILGRRRFELPYSVRLEKFNAEFHPGTTMAKAFESTVTKLEDGSEEQKVVSMNEPLRRLGYTVFQTNWGPQPQGGPRSIDPNETRYSVFEVSTNPSDRWPLWACIIVGIGLGIHFLQMLIAYLRRTRRNMQRNSVS